MKKTYKIILLVVTIIQKKMHKIKILSIIISGILLGTWSVHARTLEDAEYRDEYLVAMENYILESIMPVVPGAALAVIADGKIKFIRGFGIRKAGEKGLVTDETVFRLASVSKTFASAAAGILVQENKLMWNEQIGARLQYISFKNPDYGQSITLKEILSHTTGLMPHAYTNLVEDNLPYKRILERLDKVDFICAPGECYSYQNVVFSLVGDMINSVTGVEYETFVTENLFVPLDMQRASFGLHAFMQDNNRATPHVRRNGQWKPVQVNSNYYNIAPAAGANASISDMAKWLLVQLGQRQDVLPDSALDDLHTKAIRTTPYQAHYRRRGELGDIYYGLGWRVFDYAQLEGYVHHGGGVQGTRAEIVFNRELQIGMAFLTNAEIKDTSEIVFNFLEIYGKYNRQQPDGKRSLATNCTQTNGIVGKYMEAAGSCR